MVEKTPFELLEPKTEGQKELKKALEDKDNEIIGIFGLTGTGKSLFAISYGIHAILKENYKRFVICRPIIDITTGKEYTTAELGELYYKIASEYLEDIFTGIYPIEEIKKLLNEGKIVFVDSHYLRGRTFDNSIIFVDDIQNLPIESAAEILMRVGNNSRLIVAGDPILQKPVNVEKDTASLLRESLLNEENAKVVDLGIKDIVRPGAKRGIKIAFEMRMRKRTLTEEERKLKEIAENEAPNVDIITVLIYKEEKEKFGLTEMNLPDALIVVKEGQYGRLVGKGGERIRKIEEESGLKIKVVDFDLDFAKLVATIHPIMGIEDYIEDVDFAGPELLVEMRKKVGKFIGSKGMFVKFVDAVMRKLLGVGVKVKQETSE